MFKGQRGFKNNREAEIAEKYVSMGYGVLKKGWPDFLFYKDDEVIFVEVKKDEEKKLIKTRCSRLSKPQRKMLEILNNLSGKKISVKLEFVD